MTTAEERDAIEAEYERTIVCVRDCPVYSGYRQSQEELEIEDRYERHIWDALVRQNLVIGAPATDRPSFE